MCPAGFSRLDANGFSFIYFFPPSQSPQPPPTAADLHLPPKLLVFADQIPPK
jgi:hypothetical protein